MRLLLVEDDEILGDGLNVGLTQRGYAVDWMSDGLSAISALRNESFDVVVLDINLPGCSGLDVLKELRARKDATPVLLLTARDTVDDRVKGLDAGADDYVVKPFELNEVCARLRALERRRFGQSSPLIEYAGVVIDPAAHSVTLDGEPVDLSKREFLLLKMLLEQPGHVFSKGQIEQSLYAWDNEIESNAIEVHIHHLRKKLGTELIRTRRGLGYVVE
jgi:two-component system OmpR family response regulator/two-component system response regulator QseB